MHDDCLLRAGRSYGVAVRPAGLPVRRGHPQLARLVEPRPRSGPAAGHPARSVRARTAAVDRQLRAPRRLRRRLPAVVCHVAVRALPRPPGQDRERASVHVRLCVSVRAARRAVLRQPALPVSELPVLQLPAVRAGVLSQHGSEHLPIADLLMPTAIGKHARLERKTTR